MPAKTKKSKKQEQAEKLLATAEEKTEEKIEDVLETEETLSEEISAGDVEGFLAGIGMPETDGAEIVDRIEEVLGIPLRDDSPEAATGRGERGEDYVRERVGGEEAAATYTAGAGGTYTGVAQAEVPYGEATEPQYETQYAGQYQGGNIPTLAEAEETEGLVGIMSSFGASKEEVGQQTTPKIERYVGFEAGKLFRRDTPAKERLDKEKR